MNLVSAKPTLARPVVNILRPHDPVPLLELGPLDYAVKLWNGGIQAFPVLVRDTIDGINTNDGML